MRVLGIVALVGCGRIGFDALGAADASQAALDGPRDAASNLVHRYGFSGDLHDDLGGPDLVAGTAGTFGPMGYTFPACGGLELGSVAPISPYTVDLEFSLQSLSSWRKLVDYETLGADTGLYTFDLKYQFVIVPMVTFATSTADVFAPNVVRRATLTRDAGGAVAGYVDGVQVIAFLDSATPVAEVTSARTMWFFRDDTSTANECDAGTVRRIEIFDAALPATDVANL